MADRLGLDRRQRGVVYYSGLLAWIGCHADSHELAGWFGDDIALRAGAYRVDWAGMPMAGLLLRHAGRGHALPRRGALALSLLAGARARLTDLIRSHCVTCSCGPWGRWPRRCWAPDG